MARSFHLLPLVLLLVVTLQAGEFTGDQEKDRAKVLARRNWWSFQPVKRPDVPALRDSWIRNPIDAFLLDAMRAKGVEPSPAASKMQLLRRVTLDLTGLPPKPEDMAAFLADARPDAYERVVDRLLASLAVWRAMGPALAGCRQICRHEWLRT